MNKGRLILINILALIIIVALIAGGGYLYYEKVNYVKTEDAVVSANVMQVYAPTSGVLLDWNVKEGNKVSVKQEVGYVTDGKQTFAVNSAMSGKIVKNEAKENQMVQAGQVLAQTADMDHLFITANIKETDFKNIKVGSTVDIKVDGDSGTVFNGTVEEIGFTTNSVFSALPSQNTSGSYTKVTQKVPVKISIYNPSEKVLPGMNAQVKISL